MRSLYSCTSLSLSLFRFLPSRSSAHAPVGGYTDSSSLYTFTLGNITHSEPLPYASVRAAHGLWHGTRLLSFTPVNSMQDADRHDSEQPRDQSRLSSSPPAAVRATDVGNGSPAAPVRRAGGGVRALLQ